MNACAKRCKKEPCKTKIQRALRKKNATHTDKEQTDMHPKDRDREDAYPFFIPAAYLISIMETSHMAGAS